MPATTPADSTLTIFRRFLRFGMFAWGGPVAQIALLREELVERDRWVEPERFNRAMAVYQVLPGPEATELCVYLGHERGGRRGGFAAGLGFILPGILFVLAAAIAYRRFGIDGPVAVGLFAGFAPAVAALVLRATRRIAAGVLLDRWRWVIAALAAAAQVAGVSFAVSLVAGGAALALVARGRTRGALFVLALVAALAVAVAATDAPSTDTVRGPRSSELRRPGLGEVATAGLRGGLLTFGGAYTSIAFVERDAVTEGRWMTRKQFLDGLAVSSAVPSPLIVFATFDGYVGGGGLLAALVMTTMIFAPAFGFTLLGHRHLERAVHDPRLHAFLDGVTAAVVGLMAVIAVTLTIAAVPDLASAVLLVGALVALQAWRSRAAIVVVLLACGAAGIVLHLLAR
jgi:chromate transporter